MASNNYPSFNIPSLIPPLPSSSSSYGKENERNVRNQKDHNQHHQQQQDTSLLSSKLKDSPQVLNSSNRSTLSLCTPQTNSRHADKSSASRFSAGKGSAGRDLSRNLQASPSPGSINSATKNREHRSVLRFGETTDIFFCITEESSQEHRRLSKHIADGSLADDPKAWRQVLQFASDLKSSNDNGTTSNLISLHRRATLRFPLDQMCPDNREDTLGIWLSFAAIRVKLGMIDEARRTWRYMENCMSNQKPSLGASFYLEVSRMEQDFDRGRSEDVLRRGLQRKAEPQEMLQEALDKLCGGQIPALSDADSSTIKANSENVDSLSPRKRKIESDSSPKRQKTEEGYILTVQDAPVEVAQNMSQQSLPRSAKRPVLAPLPMSTKLSSKSSIDPSSNSKPAGTRICLNPAAKPPASLRSRPRLGRVGLSGKATRVEAEKSVYEESDSDSEPETTTGTCVESEKTVEPSQSAAKIKIKKIDLSYMFEWDPNARAREKTPEIRTRKPLMERIEEGSSSGGKASTASSHTTLRSGETTTATTSTASTIHSKKTDSSRLSTEVKETPKPPSEENALSVEDTQAQPPTTERPSDSSQNDLLPEFNREFLPLVHVKNIVRVNGSSYAKLGVIGKGGSCKVYRALSKKCAVVAIKKVKLDGMDQKAILGYANEISLLKRLQGNSAIIQMYDSEVDLARKSIFVVMEVGEADLNHVIQQRALSGVGRSLNLNFIRLTWQQMLSAVHSIHEERIIHSDLKPANFLFVKGVLKLIDFGIAKAIQSDDTTNIYRESHIGTLNYMPPEALMDTATGNNGPRMRIGRASDVWSLGCILYELVHGTTPFAKLHFLQKLQAIINPNHPIEYSDEADDGAIDAIKQCLQRNPEDRPPIVGKGGLLSEHHFLHSSTNQLR